MEIEKIRVLNLLFKKMWVLNLSSNRLTYWQIFKNLHKQIIEYIALQNVIQKHSKVVPIP